LTPSRPNKFLTYVGRKTIIVHRVKKGTLVVIFFSRFRDDEPPPLDRRLSAGKRERGGNSLSGKEAINAWGEWGGRGKRGTNSRYIA